MSWERGEKAQWQTGTWPTAWGQAAAIPESGKVPAVQPTTTDNPLSNGRLQHIGHRREF